MQEIKTYLYELVPFHGEENWEISIACQGNKSCFKGMAKERKFKLSIPWTELEVNNEKEAYVEMISLIKTKIKP
jgi:hypothetical protein